MHPHDLVVRQHVVPNNDGWRLALKQTFSPVHLDRRLRPLVIVPGYGMNAFIFGYHPRGLSMEAYLAQAGFEVWSVNLRRQGDSERVAGDPRGAAYGLKQLGLTDLGAAIDFVVAMGETRQPQVDAIGCSLGATLIYMQAALAPAPKIAALVSMGGALRLGKMHPVIEAAFASPTLVGLIPVPGARRLAELALPVLTRVPWLLELYLHPAIVDLSKSRVLARTVENPSRVLNRELARWIRDKDVIVDGRNLTEEFVRRVRCPLLSVVASGDGIVPRDAALSAHDLGRMEVRHVLEVGTPNIPIAHADLFISDYSQDWVFAPVADWLQRRQAEALARPA